MTPSPPEREEPGAPRPEGARPLSSPRPVHVARRPETEADAAFRLALFRASRGSAWDQIPLPAELLTQVMEQQFSAQIQGYRAAYPQARLEIVTVDDLPVGRLATDHGADALHLIDIAVIPERRSQGIGGTILRALMDEAAGAGTPLTLQVARDNLAAQRFYHRLEFALAAADDTHLTLRWPPSPSRTAVAS
jgi:ribosomal protein S18 acetylase RimI-like enzyme